MKVLLFAFLSLIAFSIQSQTFEENIQKGDDLYSKGFYRESAEAYQKAFEIKEGNSGEYYNAACSWALAGDTIWSVNYLNLAADKGWTNLKHIKSDKDLLNLHSTHAWNKVLEKVQANLDFAEKDFDKPLKAQLERIYVRDQTLRQLYRTAEEKFGADSEEMNYFWDLVSEQDSLNELEVVQIIEDRGWVGRSLVGGQANMTMWLVIQHAPLEIQEKYLPLLQQSVMEGESSGSHLALLEDRIQMYKGEPQTYGSQITKDAETGADIVYKIREPEYVNQRRKAVGLGPIQDYLKNWGIVWTIEQKEK
ncbi:MAG: hypothetical protein RL226_1619 [Bacteroidota bacterium]|jgi:tetratricopeptide (TPR) repeat protein